MFLLKGIIDMHPTVIKINTQQFITNLQSIRKQIGPHVKLCVPVKANGYGHGIVEISQVAEPYVDYLAVSCLEEGRLLVEHQIHKPILVFGSFDDEQIPELIENKLEITVASQEKADALAKYCASKDIKCRVHIGVDTGMNRIGVGINSAKELIDFVLQHPRLELIGVYSHFAASDGLEPTLTEEQIQIFGDIADYIKRQKPSVICHLANSGGVAYYPPSYFDMVRPGLMSYGYFPAGKVTHGHLSKIKPCFSLTARILHFKTVAKGQGISYSHRYYTGDTTHIATIQIGYGDGYRRGLSNLGQVLIGGKKYPIVGNVCMDMLMVDMGPDGEAKVGDEVILIGQQGDQEILLDELADKLNTINYEILVGFNDRVRRVLVN